MQCADSIWELCIILGNSRCNFKTCSLGKQRHQNRGIFEWQLEVKWLNPRDAGFLCYLVIDAKSIFCSRLVGVSLILGSRRLILPSSALELSLFSLIVMYSAHDNCFWRSSILATCASLTALKMPDFRPHSQLVRYSSPF